MKLKNVLVSTKQTAYEFYAEKYEDLREVFSAEEIAFYKNKHTEHYDSLNHIRKTLEFYSIPYQRVYMPYGTFPEFKDRDLIIAIGGDGTVLKSAHYVLDNTPILSVKSESRSVGALCVIDSSEFKVALEKILGDNFKTEDWTRAEGKVSNSKPDLALNDILVGPKFRPGAARYEVSFKDKKEVHMGSGLVVSTGAGSTGWYINIAGSEGTFDRTAKELRFIATEYTTGKEYQLIKGKILPDEVLNVKSLMTIDGIVSYDGDKQKRMTDFNVGQSIQIKISDKPISAIVF
ncbi:MAG: NAD(+)/NADH kinase [archaeon]